MEPDAQTLAEITGIPRTRIARARKAYTEVSESGLLSEKGDTAAPDTGQKQEHDPWVDYVYYDLDPKSRLIFEHVTGYNGAKKLTKTDIAKKLKMTAPAVSYRVKQIIKQMEARPAGNLI